MKLQQKTTEKLRNLINEEIEYRSGPKLIDFFNDLGFKDTYGQGFPSRWIYTDDKLSKINNTSDMDKCIKKLFSPVNFIGKYEELNKFINDFNQYLAFDGWKIIITGKEISFKKADDLNFENINNNEKEDEFLNKEFKEIDLDKLNLDSVATEIIKYRFEEIKKCLNIKAPLSVILLSGSSLEGILLGLAIKYPKKFNQTKSSPKDINGNIKRFQDWSLNDYINVAHDIGAIKEDVKKFSHNLRDFRNYIHPYEQILSQFNPDEHTAKICWQVLKAAIFQLSNNFTLFTK